MKQALFLNGVYDNVLQEIISSQSKRPGLVCYLQPYKSAVIRLLKTQSPSEAKPVTFYASSTKSLGTIRYTGEIVGWMDKRELWGDTDRLQSLNEHIRKHQPGEQEVYPRSPTGAECVNLIAVKNVKRLEPPVSVATLTKVSDGKPYGVRRTAGGWSPVYELPDWIGKLQVTTTREQLEADLKRDVEKSAQLSAQARRKRLENAPRLPASIQVISRGFRRNPDVIVEVLARARGKCERCGADAPFRRAKDGSPYLEIHHKTPLAEKGEDTVENAMAVCPNCHMWLHYGMKDSSE